MELCLFDARGLDEREREVQAVQEEARSGHMEDFGGELFARDAVFVSKGWKGKDATVVGARA